MSDEYDDEQARWWEEEAERKDALAVAARELNVMVHVPSQEDVTRAYLDRAMAGVTNAFCPTGKGGGQDNSCYYHGTTTEFIESIKKQGLTRGSLTEDLDSAKDVASTLATRSGHNPVVIKVKGSKGIQKQEGYMDVFEIKKTIRDFEIVENAFCPTGPGGGQDNSCPPRKMGTTWPGFSPSGHPTETLEFAEWFSGSKVVDEHGAPKDTAPIRGVRDGYGGEPIVVYHGSPRGEFHEFKKEFIADADHLHFGPGFYFTEDVVAAEQFAKGGHSAQATGMNPTTMSYYLKSTKPFDVDKDSIDPSKLPERERGIARSLIVQKTYAEEGRSEAVQKGKEFDKGEVRIPYRSLTSDRGVGGFGLDKHAVKDYLVSQGHDSLTTLMHDQGSPGKNRYWIIFEPDQVKSTRNKGNFTIGDPNVLNKDQLLERIGQLIDNRREFFAECPRDEKGHCLPEGSKKVVDPGELAKARQIAERKAAEARKPTKEEKEHAQKKLEEMGANKYRRNIVGNTSDRRKRREALLKEFGDGKTCPCIYCGLKIKEGTLEQDKIYTTAQGGKYRVDNVVPSCSSCNKRRGDTPWKDVKW